MNSTEKGTSFEKRVYHALQNELDKDRFFILKKNCNIFRQKKYYSTARLKDITIDIAIECYREGSEKPNLYILIECKDYKRKVTAGDLEKFHRQKEQIASANAKCILFTSTHLQEAAFNYAHSMGIGVVRLLDDDELSWLIERADNNLSTSTNNSDAINVINAITNEFFISTYQNTFGFVDGKAYLKIEDILFDLLNS